MDEKRGWLGFVERVFELVEGLWTFLVVGGLFAGAIFFYVLYLMRG